MEKKKNNQLGFGTAAIGRPLYINIKQKKTASTISQKAFTSRGIDLLDAAYNQGLRYFDTAPGYGIAEQMLIDWVAKKADPTIEIATKWGYTYVANFDPKATQHEVKEHSLAKLNEQWTTSKKLLPLLSTYQIHSATLETGVLENKLVLHRLAELRQKYGLHIAITTTGANQVEVLKKAFDVQIDGEQLFDAYQVTYNIFEQDLATVAEVIAKENKRLIIKEALANGRVFPNEQYAHYAKAYKFLQELAQKYNVGIDAIALRFCMDSIPTYSVLSGASNQQQLSENVKALTFTLDDTDIATFQAFAVAPKQYWTERKQLGWN